jgi:hypothetical protein
MATDLNDSKRIRRESSTARKNRRVPNDSRSQKPHHVLRADFARFRSAAWQLQAYSSATTVTPGETTMQLSAIGRAFDAHVLTPCRLVRAKRIHDDCLIGRNEKLISPCACGVPVCVCGALNCICAAPCGVHLVTPQLPRPPFSLSLTAQYVQNSDSVQRFMMGELPIAMLLRLRMEWSHRYHPPHAGRQLDLRI